MGKMCDLRIGDDASGPSRRGRRGRVIYEPKRRRLPLVRMDAHRASGGRACGSLGLVATDDEREQARRAVHDALARMPGWAVGPSVDNGDSALWHVTRVGSSPP